MTTELVSGSYYTVLGIEPAAGRLLGAADDVLSPASPAVVISDRYWEQRFDRWEKALADRRIDYLQPGWQREHGGVSRGQRDCRRRTDDND